MCVCVNEFLFEFFIIVFFPAVVADLWLNTFSTRHHCSIFALLISTLFIRSSAAGDEILTLAAWLFYNLEQREVQIAAVFHWCFKEHQCSGVQESIISEALVHVCVNRSVFVSNCRYACVSLFSWRAPWSHTQTNKHVINVQKVFSVWFDYTVNTTVMILQDILNSLV